MKSTPLITIIVLSFIIPFSTKSQDNPEDYAYSANKSGASPLFGKDIVIYDDPSVNQKNMAICTAFNGWLFGALTYLKPDGVYVVILQSSNNGLSWTIKMDEAAPFSNTTITKLSLTTSGNSIENMRLFMGIIFRDTVYHVSKAWLGSYHIEPFTGAGELLNDFFDTSYDINLCNDVLNPAIGSNPNSIGVIYSKSATKDSIIFRSSSNGGISLDNRRIVAVTENHVDHVALGYGVSASFNAGRYFASWEEKDTPGSEFGHIFLAHSEPGFNCAFTAPLCLDSLAGTLINQCKNPSIACQSSSYDNDSANITTVLLYETINPGNSSNDIGGFFNMQTVTSDYFKSLTLAETEDNEKQQDISFNPFDSTFIVTFYNETLQKLPYLTNDVNLTDPDFWGTISAGYNDENTLVSPCPRITLNYHEESGACTWISQPEGGNGRALFDAFYSTYTGSDEILINKKEDRISLYPNPARAEIHIAFTTDRKEYISITLINPSGQSLKCITEKEFKAGSHNIDSDLSGIPTGIYFIRLQGETFSDLTSVIIID